MLDTLRLLAVYGGSCALVLWLIHRHLRPVPWAVALLLAFMPFAFTGKAMLTGGLYGGLNLAYNTAPLGPDRELLPETEYQNGILMDQVCQVIPWRKAVREAVKTGHWPLRNRFSRGGDPLLGLSQPAPFDPKVWLGFLLPLATAITFACSFVFFQTAAFTWLYLRELKLSDTAALVGAAAYMASHFVTFWVGWSMSSVWAVLPLLVFGVTRLARGQRGGFGATVAASTLALVGGHPESVLHIATVSGIVLLAEWRWAARSTARSSGWPRLRRTLLAGLAAGALAAPAVLPFLDAMVQTADFKARQQVSRHNESLPVLEASRSVVGAFLPWAYGRPHHDAADTKPLAFDAAVGVSVGGAAWVLAAVGLASANRRRWLYAAIGGVAMAVASGFPIVTDLLASLPVYSITLNARLAGVAAFCLAVLAAFGADALLRGGVSEAGRRGSLFAAPGLLIALAGLHMATADLPRHLLKGLVLSLPGVLIPALLVACFVRVGVRRATWAAPFLLALVLLPRPTEAPNLYRTFPTDRFFPPLAELGTIPDFQADGSEPFRVTGPFVDMVPATGALWHLEDVRGYATMRHFRQHKTLSLWCDPATAWWFCQVRDFNRPFLSALNVRYLVAAPHRDKAQGWELVTRGDNVTLWENPDVLPRAFAPSRVLRIDPGTLPPGQIAELDDFRVAAAIEFDGWNGPAPEDERGDFRRNPSVGERAKVSTRAEGPDLVVTVDAPAATWIVVSETPWRGWRAHLEGGRRDGERLELTYANVSMLAFEAPAGHHVVRLSFWPVSFTLGLALAAGGMLALGTALFKWRGAGNRPVRQE